jgi:hypothetical protein
MQHSWLQDGQMYYIVDDANQQYVTINNELVQIVHDPRVQHQTSDQSEMFIEAIDDNQDESASNENNTEQRDQAKDSTPNKPQTHAAKHEQPSDGDVKVCLISIALGVMDHDL